MAALAARGHEVSYFLSGRQYPLITGPRLKRWRLGAVEMHEVINPPVIAGLEFGTRHPDREISEPRTEAAFSRVLRSVRPDVVHIQELSGLPSSVVDVAADHGVPTVMTLQDYFPLCATLRLLDVDDRICMRREVGEDCVARNADAAPDARPLIAHTLRFEVTRARHALRLGARADFAFRGRIFEGLLRRAADRDRPPEPAEGTAPAADPAPAAAFQRRREVNVERLGRIDRLVAQSPRVEDVYRTLGVPGERLGTLPFTLAHIERLRPRTPAASPSPLTFATLNGCASPSKGSNVVLAALRELRAWGAEGSFRFRVLGHVSESVRSELLDHEGVELHGLYRREELDALLEDVDVGIVPSIWEEAFGYAGLELVAKGVPLIANPLGGIVEYALEGQTAWLNPSCSGEGIAEIMTGLVREPDRVLEMHRTLMGERTRLITPMALHVDAIEAVYNELAEGQSSSVR